MNQLPITYSGMADFVKFDNLPLDMWAIKFHSDIQYIRSMHLPLGSCTG